MTEFPFSVTIKPTSAEGHAETVVCTGLLRSLEGKRKVLDATCGERPVILKLFTHRIKAKHHMMRERRGLKLLEERDLSSPRTLFSGRVERRGWAVVTQRIADAVNVQEVWDKTTDAVERRELLCLMSRELAKQHSKGVLQKDLHLGNFVVQNNKLFALDPAEMRFLSHEVNKTDAIRQLALLLSILAEEEAGAITNVCREYAQARSWEFGASDMAALGKKLAKYRKAGIKNGLRKCLRTNRRYETIKRRGYCGVATRTFLEKVDIDKLVQEIDGLMQRGQVLKAGNTCFVSHINVGVQEVVVKRYNHKGMIHSLRHTIKRSRGRRSWLHAHRLEMLGAATPKPLAYIEERRGVLVWKSYFVTQHVKGQKLSDLASDRDAGEQERLKITGQLRGLLEKLGRHRITHGDLKHSNIIITVRRYRDLSGIGQG
ncbi:MAG: lipopolysaccharide kinase InaA family protein [Planctomycetota bacterium]|jgi:tRNA A-37 threonylcarbamoyl transferase component Bud32